MLVVYTGGGETEGVGGIGTSVVAGDAEGGGEVDVVFVASARDAITDTSENKLARPSDKLVELCVADSDCTERIEAKIDDCSDGVVTLSDELVLTAFDELVFTLFDELVVCVEDVVVVLDDTFLDDDEDGRADVVVLGADAVVLALTFGGAVELEVASTVGAGPLAPWSSSLAILMGHAGATLGQPGRFAFFAHHRATYLMCYMWSLLRHTRKRSMSWSLSRSWFRRYRTCN